MSRWLIHWLLTLTLVLNGFSAPLTMAAMTHDARIGDSPTAPHAHHAAERAAATSERSGLSEHPRHGAKTSPSPTAIDDRCCDGMQCHCGCVLPHAVALAPRVFSAYRLTDVRFTVVAAHAPRPSPTPPFRPPAA
ncbi:CopL family metal-binding regulatory protein [Tahibacter aquaticus]|uniref:CopL family metal-binding regulatory protein n=1 Tax=Tahibacter aquaticus TaxID=520092 RepID=UPI0010611F11